MTNFANNPCQFDPSFTHGFQNVSPTGVFDCNNPDATDMEFNLITQVGVFDRDNPHQPACKKNSDFDQDNPAAKCTEPLKGTGNIFPLFGIRKSTGNCVSVPLLSDFAANPFTGPVPLTSDLEPDCSDYFTIPTSDGEFICERFIYSQFLLLTGSLFVQNYFMTKSLML